jgi:type VI secretion system secreted protein VgrG
MPHLSQIKISLNGKPLHGFQYISINHNLYGIDSFEITCRYDILEKLDDFLIENSKDLLGSTVLIQTKMKINDEEKDGISFQGFVTEIQSNRSGTSDADYVIISGGSKEILLNRKPHNRAFIDKKLEDIVDEVLKDYPLSTKIKTRNKQLLPYILQYEESDLEFIKRLSIRYGEWFFFNGTEVIFGEIPVIEHVLSLGFSLKEFRYELKTAPVKFQLFSQDPLSPRTGAFPKYKSGNKKIESSLNIYGKHALKKSGELFPLESNDYYEHLNVGESEYQQGLDEVGEIIETADAVNLADIAGSSIFGLLAAGVYVKINCPKQDGKNKMDYGRYLVTSVHHNMDNSLHYSNTFTAIPGETVIPENTDPYFVRTSSNQIGFVTDNKDPEKLGRVKISLWWMDLKTQSTPWVRVLTPYSGANWGFYFVPAKNSRVLVGFENGDVERPYCLGQLWDKQTCPDPDWVGNMNENNAKIHAIRTISGQTIELHDESGKERIRIYDFDGNNELLLDQANNNITIKTKGDLHLSAGGTLKIHASNVEISADNNITIKSGGSIKQNASDINLEANTNIKLSAVNIDANANASLKASGTGNAEVSSSGVLVVKGSLVQIN